jgi:hypothetical protein
MNIWRRIPAGRISSGDIVFNNIAKGFWETSGITYYGTLKRWTGSQWLNTLMKVFTNTWQAKPLKRWDGTEWKLINNN